MSRDLSNSLQQPTKQGAHQRSPGEKKKFAQTPKTKDFNNDLGCVGISTQYSEKLQEQDPRMAQGAAPKDFTKAIKQITAKELL